MDVQRIRVTSRVGGLNLLTDDDHPSHARAPFRR